MCMDSNVWVVLIIVLFLSIPVNNLSRYQTEAYMYLHFTCNMRDIFLLGRKRINSKDQESACNCFYM